MEALVELKRDGTPDYTCATPCVMYASVTPVVYWRRFKPPLLIWCMHLTRTKHEQGRVGTV